MALEGPQCAGVGLAPSGLAAITTTLLVGAQGRRSSAGLRQRLSSLAQFLQRHAGPLRRRDHLFRSADRRRHRGTVQAQHQGGAGRGARLAILRNARHSRDRLRSRMRAARSSSTTTPGRRRCITARSIRASTSACRPPPNISAAIPTSCSARSRPTPRPGRCSPRRIRLLGVCAGPDDVFLALRGTAHAGGAAGAASPLGPRDGALARRPARSRAGVASGARKPSGPRDLEARFHRRVRPVQHRAEARAAKGGRCPARYRQAVRHGLFLGRLREPRHPLRLRRPIAPPPNGRRAARRCGSISGWRMSTTSRPISSAALRR